jgi:hypothetical protein
LTDSLLAEDARMEINESRSNIIVSIIYLDDHKTRIKEESIMKEPTKNEK